MSAQSGFIFSSDPRTGASTPEELKKRRAIAEAMWSRQAGSMPKDAAEGISLLGQALIHRVGMNSLAKEEEAGRAKTAAIGAELFGGSGTPAVGPGAGFAGSTGAISDGSDPRFTMGNAGREIAAKPSDAGIYDSFIGTVKDSGLSNPYGLAAVAATGQAESGYSAKNAFGEWSDPSESGGAGQAGGVMSWRADRLANMRRFATQNGDDPSRPSPETQAKFFMAEDPSLIAKLQSAQSVEEAQRHMNNAWRFAGYDRPGGEAARRMKAAAGFLPRFSDAGGAAAAIERAAPVQVASADPGFMPAAQPGNATAIMAALNPSQAGQAAGGIPAPVRNGIAANIAAGTLRGEQPGTGGSTIGQPEVDAMAARQAAERASNPNIRPWSGPAEIDGREMGSREARIGAALGIQPGSPQGMSPVAAALNRPVQPLPPAQSIAANPVPPQGGDMDPLISPAARSAMLGGAFDGFAYQGGQSPDGGVGSPAIPAAPGGAPVGPQAVPSGGPSQQTLMRIISDPWASDQQREIAGMMLQQQMKPREYGFQTLPDGTILRTDPRTGQVSPVYQAKPKPIEVNGRLVDASSGTILMDLSDRNTTTVDGTVIDLDTGKPVYTAPQRPTGGMQEYDAYAADERAAGRQPIGRLDYEQALRKSSAQTTTINTGDSGSGAFYKTADEARAKQVVDAAALSNDASRRLIQIDQLQGILGNVETGGWARAKQVAGEWGINTEGLSDIQAATALISKMVPSQRIPGSGTMSDADLELFKASLPRIINQPGGNALILQTMRGIANYDGKLGAIANRVLNREITPAEGQSLMSSIENPLARFNEATRTREAPAGDVARPADDAAYNALPSGALFVDPDDGKTYRKP